MATIFTSTDAQVLMPREIADGMIKRTRTESVIARLSNREPMRFGKKDYLVFNDFPKAEFVEEGAQKSPTKGGFSSVTAVPHKAQVTMRFSEEAIWTDEDYQLEIVNSLASEGSVALSRALDLGMIHRVNPLTGQEIASWDNYVAKTTKSVTLAQAGADPDDDFASAVGLLVNQPESWGVSGAAFDPKFSWALSQLKRKDGAGATSDRRYPELGFGTNVTSFMGVPVAQGDTVSGLPEIAADSKIRAIVGDFRGGVRWGVQRQLPIELIRFGDPDGQGDLKRQNQVALRLEIVYGWYVFVDRFALLKVA